MIKKTVTYTDYNGNNRTETYYFHLTQAELAEMELSVDGGFTEMIKKISETNDTVAIAKVFKDLLLKSYGEKSVDGKYFLKTDDNGRPLYEKFSQSEAYSQIYIELSTNSDKAIEFFNKVIPSDMQQVQTEVQA